VSRWLCRTPESPDSLSPWKVPVAEHSDNLLASAQIPDKLHFKIGEVSAITGVKPHVLRYWESEFSALRPQKTPSKQRLYRRRDVELLLLIKQLLYQEGFTIAGANKRIRELSRAQHAAEPAETREVLAHLEQTVEELLEIVDED
jgi:DNA-binding transcriptional MerR regulator